MSGDYSRLTFDPLKGYAATFLQQGRVALDSDWNEWVSAVERRIRVAGLDIMGRSAVPRETADGFKITASVAAGVKALSIGRGRIYVDGLLVENAGPMPAPAANPPARFDLVTPHASGFGPAGVLGELMGGDQLSYLSQPFLLLPQPLPAADGPHLVYLDVWQREVTAVEDESLLEPALGGVDTTTRLQTVWQVKLLEDVGNNVNCSTPDADVPGWLALTRASAARLTTELVPVPPDDDPCLVPPTSGYKGLENQLYRVEIHTGGLTAAARFKWSRENASVATNVTGMENTRDVIVVERVGRDDFLRIREGDWIEVTDDRREFAGRSGDLRKVAAVVSSTRRITLTVALTADLQPAGTPADNFGTRHTRVRKWDQRGAVLDGAGNVLVDLDAPGSDGTIPIPAGGGAVRLEAGIQLRFNLEPGTGTYHVADYWNFAARVASGTIDELRRAPPRGIHHHYARLAVVTFPATATDCRHIWPPDFGNDSCACNVCVTPESHASGVMTLQRAVDQVKDRGGTVCLEEGVFELGDTPVRIENALGVHVTGKGAATVVNYAGTGAMFRVEMASDIAIRDMNLAFSPGIDLPGGGISFRNTGNIVVERCGLAVLDDDPTRGTGITLEGIVINARLRENSFHSGNGIVAFVPQEDDNGRYVSLQGVLISNNRFTCGQQGVNIGGTSFLSGELRIADNWLSRCEDIAIAAEIGNVDPDLINQGRAIVSGNMILAAGRAIRVGTSFARVVENNIRRFNEKAADAITIAPDPDGNGLRSVSVAENIVGGGVGHGVVLATRADEIEIVRNRLQYMKGAGIYFSSDSGAQDVLVEANFLQGVGLQPTRQGEPLVGILVANSSHVRIQNNCLRDIALGPRELPAFGIEVYVCDSIYVRDNELVEIGIERLDSLAAGILVALPVSGASVDRNFVRRSVSEFADRNSQWFGIVVLDDIGQLKQAYAAADRAKYVRAPGKLVAIKPSGFALIDTVAPGRLCVANNAVLGSGGAAETVLVTTKGACQFLDNQCEATPDTGARALVQLTASAAVASNNVLLRKGDGRLAMQLQVGSAQQPGPFTILGNVSGKRTIEVNGAILQAPWEPFNA